MTLCIPKLSKYKILFFSLQYIRVSGKNINFGDKKNQKKHLLQKQKIYSTDDIDVSNILVSKKEPYSRKNYLEYFIGHNDNDIIRPLCIRLPRMTGYARKFDENATMSFIIKK